MRVLFWVLIAVSYLAAGWALVAANLTQHAAATMIGIAGAFGGSCVWFAAVAMHRLLRGRHDGRDEPSVHWAGVENAARPPTLAEALLALATPTGMTEALIGDAEERFKSNVLRVGARRARMLYRVAVLKSLGPLMWAAAKRIGLLAVLADAYRRLFS
ncbi:permease prefix domain 2-containing transporter [Bauldia sp.]|uniref:permease prefix domain 2-containing transporter n=1 Tax=Bauldia sp. TaxID=2575872 RepID=UPI003BAA00D0